MARPKKSHVKPEEPTGQGDVRLHTLEVFLLSGPIAEKFAKKNPVISRTIEIRGDQTLEDLHDAIFDAFGRFDHHMYEFQFGEGPMDPKAPRYVLPGAFEADRGEENPPAGRVDRTDIDSLGLEVGRSFGYWFDFGDDWWHQINVEAIEDKVPAGKFPKVTTRVGKSPPQYLEEDD
jgi:Plasmid pRiA4b ORF-3-like protein